MISTTRGWHPATLLITFLFMLSMVDYGTTVIAIEQIGMGEANPVLDYLMHETGSIWAIFWFKLAGLSLLIIPYIFVERARKACQTSELMWTWATINILYLIVVITTIIKITVA